MVDGSPPPRDNETSSFTSSLFAVLPTLVCRAVQVKVETEGGQHEMATNVVCGKEALLVDWANVQAKRTSASITLEDIKDLVRF
eukprot:1339340-Amphidinium_carterae.1